MTTDTPMYATVYEALAQHGPMTCHAMTELLGEKPSAVENAIRYLKKTGCIAGKLQNDRRMCYAIVNCLHVPHARRPLPDEPPETQYGPGITADDLHYMAACRALVQHRRQRVMQNAQQQDTRHDYA